MTPTEALNELRLAIEDYKYRLWKARKPISKREFKQLVKRLKI